MADVLRLPPTLFGVIRWKKTIGNPLGDSASAFRVRLEERTPSEFRVGPDGPEKIPGTGVWRLVDDSVPCTPAPDEGDSHVVHFVIRDLHVNVFDGAYRVAAQLTNVPWDTRGLAFLYLFGYRQMDPLAWYVTLRPDVHIATVEFEVVRRSYFPRRDG